jgi:hypothetical protein
MVERGGNLVAGWLDCLCLPGVLSVLILLLCRRCRLIQLDSFGGQTDIFILRWTEKALRTDRDEDNSEVFIFCL